MHTTFQTQLIAVDEITAAKMIGMSVHWLRKDRRGIRLIPFYKIGDSVRYDMNRLREALLMLEEGGVQLKTRRAKGTS